jgi:hypothetical protein
VLYPLSYEGGADFFGNEVIAAGDCASHSLDLELRMRLV